MFNVLKEKIYLLILLAITIGLYVWVNMQWGNCLITSCSEHYIDNFLSTVEPGSLYLIGYFIVFLFLPIHYFNAWFKYIFLWAFPLSVYLVYITTGSSSIPAYGKDDVVRFWGLFYAVVTALFILYHFYKTRKQK
jgi:hypothetical protein